LNSCSSSNLHEGMWSILRNHLTLDISELVLPWWT
jgi:hypothetical protein